jgi:hypothetical protein
MSRASRRELFHDLKMRKNPSNTKKMLHEKSEINSQQGKNENQFMNF